MFGHIIKSQINGIVGGEVHSPEDYPDMLEKINNGDFRHTSHTGNNNYTKIYYQPNEDVGNTPNRLGLT